MILNEQEWLRRDEIMFFSEKYDGFVFMEIYFGMTKTKHPHS